jgi:Abortive infection C-terminus
MYGELIYKDLPRSKTQLAAPVVKLAETLFARATGMSGPEIFEFFGRHSDVIGSFRYGSGAPSRSEMFRNFLESFPADVQKSILLQLCEYSTSMKTPPPPDEVQRLEALVGGLPIPKSVRTNVQQIDSRYVTQAWEKAIERLREDPKGAVTAARTLVETVCLHVLDSLGKSTNNRGDLPALYKTVSDALSLSPDKGDDVAVRQVLGSCAGLVNGVATLRNQFGDAHGRLGVDTQRSVAHLAVNVAGSLAVFLVEALDAVQHGKS